MPKTARRWREFVFHEALLFKSMQKVVKLHSSQWGAMNLEQPITMGDPSRV
jgi:hypothetical protein